MGTAAGTHVFVSFGWRAGAALAMGLYGWQALVLLSRGPHCKRYTWFGYEGGLEARKTKKPVQSPGDSEKQEASANTGGNSEEKIQAVDERTVDEKNALAAGDRETKS